MPQPKRFAIGASYAFTSTEPPTEFPLWEFGETRFRWADGSEHSIELTPDLAQRLLDAYRERGRDLSFDYNHGSAVSVDDRLARSAGSFEVELRADGLWAVNAQWTEDAANYIRRREYRYVSPTWSEDGSGPVELGPVALTANPATLGARPLVAHTLTSTATAVETLPTEGAREEPTVDRITRIASALGLPATAPETDVALRAAALQAFEATVLQRLGASNREAAVTQIEAQADDLVAATARVAELEAQAEAAERNEVITAAVRDGRLTPAQAAEGGWARSQTVTALREFLASAPRVVPTGTVAEGEPAPDKSFADMDGPERAHLFLQDKARYLELRKASLGF